MRYASERELLILSHQLVGRHIPPMTSYTKSFGKEGGNELATVKMCVIFLLLSASLLVAAPTEPKNRPWEIKRNYRKFRQTIKSQSRHQLI